MDSLITYSLFVFVNQHFRTHLQLFLLCLRVFVDENPAYDFEDDTGDDNADANT